MNVWPKLIWGLLLVIFLAIALLLMKPADDVPVAGDAVSENLNAVPDSESANDPQVIGGVRRPAQDHQAVSVPKDSIDQEGASDGDAPSSDSPLDYGTTPAVDLNVSPETAAVAKVIENRESNPTQYTSTVSTLGKIDRFDAQRYRTDAVYRKDYLKNVEPGRVFQSAQPSKDVTQVQPLSPKFQTVRQGEAVTLRVRGTPNTPYSFTTLDVGQFADNSLTSITVEADDQGVAEADFLATPGVIDDVHLLVAGPVTSGQVKYIVHVEPRN